MTTVSRILGRAALILSLGTVAACGGGGGPSYDPESPEGQAFEYRHAVMLVAGVKQEFINNMAREQVELYEAAFAQAAIELAVLTAMMPGTFENQTLVAESLTEPSVWEEWDDFEARMDGAIEATAALAEAVLNGGFAEAQPLVVASYGTFSNCSGCHNSYRRSDDED